jgi:hypothetical protein
VFIYALCEPLTSEVRYIGKSATPEKRLIHHLCAGPAKIAAWVDQLAADGLRPLLCILEVVPPGQDAAVRERLALGSHLTRGARLLNSEGTPNGRGPRTRIDSPRNMGVVALLDLGLTQTAIAASAGVIQSNVWSWMHGKQLPDSISRAKLEDTFGIYWRLWDQPVDAAKPIAEAS